MTTTQPAPTAWHTLSLRELTRTLHTSRARGLTQQEAAKRLAKDGENKLDDSPPTPWWRLLLSELNDYLIWILLGGALLSLSLGETLDGSLILGIVGFMTILGYVQNSKAEAALASLAKISRNTTPVIRDGRQLTIPVEELVAGDLVQLRAGDAVPADLRLVAQSNAALDESTLTGESLPTHKSSRPLALETPLAERRNLAFSGTLLQEGQLTGIVVATGMATELGSIARLLSSTTKEVTPLEEQLERLGKMIGTGLLVIVAAILGLNLRAGVPLAEAGLDAVALAVAAVPEGLPAVITICLAFGTRVMVKRKALVRRLKAVEALGSVSVICTDKTGTLTAGEMTVTHTVTQAPLTHLLTIAHLCNNNADMTEAALSRWVEDSAAELPQYKKVAEHEFNSYLKRMTTIHRLPANHQYLVAVKGAPEIVLEHCTHLLGKSGSLVLTPAKRAKLEAEITSLAGRGLRVLALAERRGPKRLLQSSRESLERDLTLVGLVGLSDPPKTEVKEALKATRQAGITPIMITGDSEVTALAIGRQLGFDTKRVMTGRTLEETHAKGNIRAITHTSIFARVTPEHKSLIVQAFQQEGHYVAMIGDGVNDAPSVKLANVGVAMGTRGSDVTKSAADLVLLDDNYQTLVAAVEEGRAILNRIRRFVGYLLSCNLAEVAIFAAATLLGLPLPLSAVMLLVLNLVTDAAPALAMSQEPKFGGLMNRPPRSPNEPIITLPMWVNIGILTLVTTAAVTGAYLVGGSTLAFLTLSLLELLRAYTARSLTRPVGKIGLLTNPWVTPAVLLGLTVTLAIVYWGGPVFGTTPPTPQLLALALALALTGPLAEELIKPALARLNRSYSK